VAGVCGSSAFTGQLDEITIADRAWTLAELQAPRSQEQPVANWSYDALSRRTAMTLSNGTQTTYTYDAASQLSAVSHQLTALSQLINKADYVYNPVGNRTSLTDRRGAQSFAYDTLDRLTSAIHPLLLDPQVFAYDAVGNWTTNGSVTNAGNQLTTDANFTYKTGVYGRSERGIGVRGTSADGTGVYGAVTSPNGLAGRFKGGVLVDGDLTVTGAKGAVVPHPDGSQRLFCAIESSESWFEDFGEGRLEDGGVEIELDPNFGLLTRGDSYHVFLTAYGDSQGL